MQRVIAVLVLLLSVNILMGQMPEVKVYKKFTQLETDILQADDDKIHLINFWATWCKPCIKEMPYIDAMTEEYGDKIKVTLVSLDFPRQIDAKLIPYLIKNKLKSEVVLLEDGNANAWIDKVDPSWSGAIPATLIKYRDKKAFYEQAFHSVSEVKEIIYNITN